MLTRREVLGTALAGAVSTIVPSIAVAQDGVSKLAPPSNGPVNVAVVVGRDAAVIDFAGPWEVFGDASVAKNNGFELFMVSDEKKPINVGASGMTIVPHYDFSSAPQPNVILMGAQREHTPAKIEWIKAAGQRADLILSVCTGAFLLAQTGLLDGLTATTHHDFYDQFAKQFPNVTLIRGPRYVENGKLATAGGLSSGIELALRTVERYYGTSAAATTAYYMEYNRSANRPTA